MAALAAGCGAGSAAVAAGGGGGGGDSNAPTVLSGFAVQSAKVPPATIRFVLTDAEESQAEVELLYQVGGGAPQRLAHAPSLPSNPAPLATSKQGTEYQITWDYAAETELPHDATYQPDVRVWATVRGGIQQAIVGSNAVELGLGNTAPVVSGAVIPASESSGIVGVELVVSDVASDVVSVRVEYDLADDAQESWIVARPALLDATPPFGIRDVIAAASGTPLSFFWDTTADVGEEEHPVRLRFTAVDTDELGELLSASPPLLTEPFVVDNNEEPVVRIQGEVLLANPDQRRGIPIPFELIDEEGDVVDLVFQWRRQGEEFPDLGASAAEIRAALADPEERRRLRVAAEYAEPAEGRLVPHDATSVRLPDLAQRSAHLFPQGIRGRDLEILRASRLPAPPTWDVNPLVAPVAALPIGDGLTAIVLDAPAPGSWRLREIELANGAIRREIASGAGAPSAMALDVAGRAALVASDEAGAWRVDRVELAGGAVAPAGARDGSTEPGAIRGVASLGTHAALISVGSTLVRLDWSDPVSPRVSTVLRGLAEPWGIAVDPVRPGRVFVAEHDAAGAGGEGRVLSIDLSTLKKAPVVARATSGPGLPRPRAIALDTLDKRLFVLCDTGAGQVELRGVDLGGADGNEAFTRTAFVSDDAGSLATGADGLVVLALTDRNELEVGGGVEQRRGIASYDPPRQLAVLDRALDPIPTPAALWRLGTSARLAGTPSGIRSSFVWDSREAGSVEDVFFRVTPLDSEVGLAAQTVAAKPIQSALRTEPVLLPGALPYPTNAVVEDLDSDGRLDVLGGASGLGGLLVYFQAEPGQFAPASVIPTTSAMFDLADLADLDGDLDVDVAVAGAGGIVLHLQTLPRQFTQSSSPLATSGPATSVLAADIDSDGDQDLLAGVAGANRLELFVQEAPGAFSPPIPIEVGHAVTEAGDVDGDGDIDLLVGGRIVYQTARGVFEPDPNVALSSTAELVDLDRDGDLDVVQTAVTTNRIDILLQDGGAFHSLPPLFMLGFPNALALADLDADGDLDLAVGIQAGFVHTFFQVEPGSFDPRPVEVLVSEASPVTSLATGDLDGDGDADVAAGSSAGVGLLFQRSVGAFETTTVAPLSLGGTLQNVKIGDLDRDGSLDLCGTSVGFLPTTPRLHVAAQQAPGALDPPTTVTTGGGSDVCAVDLDGDGALDLVTAGANRISLHFRQANGAFGPPNLIEAPLAVRVRAGDVDGDGDMDLVVSNGYAGRLTVFWQDSSGVFETPGFPLDLAPGSVVFDLAEPVDIDVDGDLDLACSENVAGTGASLVLFVQSGPRQFQRRSFAGPAFSGLTPVDLDGDGDTDFVSALAASICFWVRTSPSAFVPRTVTLDAGLHWNRVTPLDLDRDGDVDLFGHDAIAQRFSVAFQTRPDLFDAKRLSYSVMGYTNDSTAVDLDRDGDPDLAAANSGPNEFMVIWNR